MAYNMKVQTVKSEGLQREYRITLAGVELKQKITERLTQVGKTAKMAGFRPGQVPLKVVEKKYGTAVIGEIVEEAVYQTTEEAFKQENIRPALQPSINIDEYKDGQDLNYTVSVEVYGDIPAVDFDAINLTRLKLLVDPKEIDKGIERIRKGSREFEEVTDADYKAKEGDKVIIDFTGYIGDSPFDGGAAKEYGLELGSGNFIEGFEAGLLGTKKDTSHNLELRFPENYHNAGLAGQDVRFEVHVHRIEQGKLAEVNQDFATKLGFEDVEKLREAVAAQITKDYDNLAHSKLKKELFDILDKSYKFAVPAGLVELELKGLQKQVQDEKNWDKEYREKSETERTAWLAEMAERRVRLGILLAEIGRAHSVAVSKDELRQAIYREAMQYRGSEKQVVEFYMKNEQAANALKGPLLEDKVVSYVLEKVKVEEKSLDTETFLKEFPSVETEE